MALGKPRLGAGRRTDIWHCSSTSPIFRRQRAVTTKTDPADPADPHHEQERAATVSPSEMIDERIRGLGDWRGEVLARVRTLVHRAIPEVVEDVKRRKPSNPMGVPVWSCAGMICTGESYNDKVKVTFARGAALPDPSGLFNASLKGNARRAIDIHEGDDIEEEALVELLRSAVQLNLSEGDETG